MKAYLNGTLIFLTYNIINKRVRKRIRYINFGVKLDDMTPYLWGNDVGDSRWEATNYGVVYTLSIIIMSES